MSLTGEERLDWLQLFRSENVGPKTFRTLIDRYGSAARALERLPDLAKKGGKRAIRVASRQSVRDEAQAIADFGGSLIALPDSDYPNLLRAIDDPPPVIAAKGALHLLAQPMVAIVGARDASAAARSFAHDLAHYLGSEGLGVVSGLARGVDRAAHVGALKSGTVAVLAGGLDKLYPRDNQDLYDRIGTEGVLLTETAMGITAQARHFPKRNRIVSGMAVGVVIVEATERSGSLITARLAREQNREVMAVPGFPSEARARGPNALIRDGATLVESAADVLEAIGPHMRKPFEEPPQDYRPKQELPPEPADSELDRVRPDLHAALGPTSIDRDTLARRLGCSSHILSVLLLELELAGKIASSPGNRVSLVRTDTELPLD